MLKLDLITPEVENFLESYRVEDIEEYKNSKNPFPKLHLDPDFLERVEVEIPIKDNTLQVQWFGMWLFSTFSFEDFYKLFSALLNE